MGKMSPSAEHAQAATQKQYRKGAFQNILVSESL
jgi:hypothetical protein